MIIYHTSNHNSFSYIFPILSLTSLPVPKTGRPIPPSQTPGQNLESICVSPWRLSPCNCRETICGERVLCLSRCREWIEGAFMCVCCCSFLLWSWLKPYCKDGCQPTLLSSLALRGKRLAFLSQVEGLKAYYQPPQLSCICFFLINIRVVFFIIHTVVMPSEIRITFSLIRHRLTCQKLAKMAWIKCGWNIVEVELHYHNLYIHTTISSPSSVPGVFTE